SGDPGAHAKLGPTSGPPPTAPHALAVVPPRSRARMWPPPLLRAVLSAESPPPAGPDSRSRIGVSAAALPDVKPPLDTMIRSGAPRASACTRPSPPGRDSAQSGRAEALGARRDMGSDTRGSRAT